MSKASAIQSKQCKFNQQSNNFKFCDTVTQNELYEIVQAMLDSAISQSVTPFTINY